MSNEIKEILDRIKNYPEKLYCLNNKEKTSLLDCITNLQQELERYKHYSKTTDIEELMQENEMQTKIISDKDSQIKDLQQENEGLHNILKTQNEREYASKFFEEFQEEKGTNVFPDYDEIYKRYDKLKQENEKLKEENKCIFSKVNDDELLISNAMNYAEAQDYKSRVDKAIEILETAKITLYGINNYKQTIYLKNYPECNELLKILQGGKDEKENKNR